MWRSCMRVSTNAELKIGFAANVHAEETNKRQDFLDEWGESLPVDFLPLLKNDPRDSRSLLDP